MRALAFSLLLVAAPVAAQVPGTHDAQAVAAGRYRIDPDHTQVRFGVLHMGFNPYFGTFSQASGTLSIDPAHLDLASVAVAVPVASVMTTSAKLDGELKSADWLDAAKFPTMTFTSTRVTVNGTTAIIDGMLTLHGVTHPLQLQASFIGTGKNPMGGAQTVGFIGQGTIRRSDYGVTKYVPLVSDQMMIDITAAFQK